MKKIGIKERVNAFGNVEAEREDVTGDDVMKPEKHIERGIEENPVEGKGDKSLKPNDSAGDVEADREYSFLLNKEDIKGGSVDG